MTTIRDLADRIGEDSLRLCIESAMRLEIKPGPLVRFRVGAEPWEDERAAIREAGETLSKLWGLIEEEELRRDQLARDVVPRGVPALMKGTAEAASAIIRARAIHEATRLAMENRARQKVAVREALAILREVLGAEGLSIGAERTPTQEADTKADTNKKNSEISVPDNHELLRLCQAIKRRPAGVKIIDVCREFAVGNEAKARSLARSARRYPHLCE